MLLKAMTSSGFELNICLQHFFLEMGLKNSKEKKSRNFFGRKKSQPADAQIPKIQNGWKGKFFDGVGIARSHYISIVGRLLTTLFSLCLWTQIRV